MKIKRLQGLDWTQYKRNNKLVLLAIGRSKNGNYVSYTIDTNKKVIRHWLGNSEVEKLETSGWLETHTVYKSDELYNRELLKNLIKNRLQTN